MTQSTRQIMEQSQRVAAEFLIADLTVALTFLDVADTTQSRDNRLRNLEHARAAYATVLRLLPRISPSAKEQPVLETKLAQLRDRLETAGVDLDPERESPSPG